MSEFWQDVLKVVIGGAFGSLFTILSSVIIARYSKPKTERKADMLERFLQLSDMSTEQAIEHFERIDQIQQKQLVRDKEIDELKAQIKADLIDTRSLRADYAIAQKRIIKLEDMVIKLGEYTDTMKTAMQKANLDVPLNGELLESVYRLKLQREEMEKLRGKQ